MLKYKDNKPKNMNTHTNKIKELIIIASMVLSLVMPFQANASEFCDGMKDYTKGILSCGEGDQTTFTNFDGGLTPPDSSGYASELTKAKDAKEYVKNIANFALGFLGLIAVLVIIYGGFMYVTAMGKEDKTETGKKSITYAVIGLLIVMASFAIVNTVLQAPGGSDTKNLNGSAVEGTVDRRAFFNYAAVAVQQIARDFLTAYQNYSEIRTDVRTMIDTDLEKAVKRPADFKNLLQTKKNILNNIITKAGALSQVAEKAQHMLLVYNKYLALSDKAIAGAADISNQDKNFLDFIGGNVSYINYMNEIAAEAGADPNAVQSMLNGDVPNQVESSGLLGANNQDFAQAVIKAYHQLYELQQRVKQASDLPEIESAFQLVLNDLESIVKKDTLQWEIGAALPSRNYAQGLNLLASLFVNRAYAADSPVVTVQTATILQIPNNALMLQIVKHVSALYEKVKDVQFVYTVIRADVVTGNAPLVVNYDALKSVDPNNRTIPNQNFEWNFGTNSAQAVDKVGSTANYIYYEPGTYIAKLRIKAPGDEKDPTRPADGIAYTTITVKPPSSKINLQATVNGKNFWLSKFDEKGISKSSMQDLWVTTVEAKNGISLDARDTRTGNGLAFNDPTIKNSPAAKVRWDFGDKAMQNNIIEGPPDTISQVQTVKYTKEGSYRVTLEVTDDRGITDRKIFNIIVSSIAARINVTPGNELNINDEAKFDGSASSSANSQIKKFDWRILKTSKNGSPSSDVTPADSKNSDSLKFNFKDPGTYDVTLDVSDGSNDGTANMRINVVSKPPIAQFTATNTDPAQPDTFIIDATKSYDPDSNEDFAYKWEFNAAPGTCTYINGKSEEDCTLAFKDFSTDKKFAKFKVRLDKGKYTATLSVRDPSDPTKVTTQEQQISVDNDLDVGWGDDGKPLTIKLNEGEAKVTFLIKSNKGTSYELDTGDGQKENGSFIASSASIKHTYNKAGNFTAKLTVFDAENNQNNTIRKVFVASDNSPVAAISVLQNGEPVSDTYSTITANRKTEFTFDAVKSLNIDGTGKKLNYSWDFGDGVKSTKRQVTHTFTELTPKDKSYYTVSLKVTNQDDATQVSPADEIHINVISMAPVIQGLTVTPASNTLTTPLNVTVTANGAIDGDGKIVNYRWWYYDLENPEDQKGLQITQSPSTTMTIGTNGEEGQKRKYGFAVIITDNDNQTFNSFDELGENAPTLELVNGANKAPIAKFNVDHTNVMVGDTVNFSSSSSDPDEKGGIKTYIWDLEGNGFADNALNNEYNKPNVSYTFNKAYRDGVKVRLKVIDNNGAEAVSDAVIIYVDGKSNPPVAAFTYVQNGKSAKFTNNSKADESAGAKIVKYTWDCDLAADSNGDGIKDNDLDSTEENATCNYPDYGIYRAKLTVEDDQGSKGSVSNFVNVKSSVAPSVPVTPDKLEARLTSVPTPSQIDNKIHLTGETGTVIFNFSDSRGPIKYYIIDKNIYFDANGNGIKDDDEDYKTALPGTWSTQFFKSTPQNVVKLTVVDEKGNKSSVLKEIVFDSAKTPAKSLGGTDIFAGTIPGEMPGALVTLAGFGILLTSMRALKSKK